MSISPYFPCSLLCTNVHPAGADRRIETSLQGALCEHKKKIASGKGNISPLLLQLHPRGNTIYRCDNKPVVLSVASTTVMKTLPFSDYEMPHGL